jgi:hypothetical protein
MVMHANGFCHGFCRYCQSQIPHDTCRELGYNIINYTIRSTQTYRDDRGNYNLYERDIEAKQRPGQNLPADSQYTLVMPQRNEHPHAVRIMNTAPLSDWFKGWPPTHELWSRPVQQSTSTSVSTFTTSVASTSLLTSATTTSTSNTTPAQQRRFQRATDPEVMGENDFNRNRRSRKLTSTTSTAGVTTSTTSPQSTSSNSVQLVEPPPPTVIDLTVESIEDLMMADVQEQKEASDNETSATKDKATKGKRKHVATGKS